MQFPIVPLALSVGVAAVDGVVASSDVNRNSGTPPKLSKQRTLWVQGASVAVGLVGEFLNWDEDITEPLMFTGSALFAREVAFHFAQQGQTTPVAAQGQVMRPVGHFPLNAQYTPGPPAAAAAVSRGYLMETSAGLV